MSKINLNVLFKKIQKDDKKEVLEFHVQGDELPSSQELVNLAGNVALLEVENSESGQLTAEFKTIQRDSKKTALKFNMMGDSEDKVIKLYPFAGRNVTLFLEPSQMSLEEFHEGADHEGIEYDVNKDGTVEIEGQVDMEDIPFDDDSVNFDDDDVLN